jgi:exodeoxyribonuclease VII large subunit
MESLTKMAQQRLRALTTRRIFTNPQELLDIKRQRLDELFQRMGHSVHSILLQCKQRYVAAHSKLYALDPRGVLKRGYAFVCHPETGQIIKSVTETCVGSKVDVVLADGALRCEVEGVTHDGSEGDEQRHDG